MAFPLVSVVVPVFNRAKYLAQALESVLAQEYEPTQLIVVDDGSSDGSGEIARTYDQVHYLHQVNQGVAAARNAGIAASRGQFIAFLDSDDWWTPDKLSVQIDVLLRNPVPCYSLTHMRWNLEPGCALPAWFTMPWLLKEPQEGSMSSVVVPRTVLERVGIFDSHYQVGEDRDWFVRAQDAGISRIVLPNVCLHRRVHDANLSAQTELSRLNLLHSVAASARRKRAAKSNPRSSM